MQVEAASNLSSMTAPAPWKLRGRGWIFLYRFDRDFVMNEGRIPQALQSHYQGGMGAVMLVDYHTTPVGPYHELLFVPGIFSFGWRRRYYSVTSIYVSTQTSVDNGQENWGIPKQIADFDIEPIDRLTQRVRVASDETVFFDATLKSGVLRFPVNTLVNPFPATLVQQRDRDDAYLLTTPQAGGVVSPTAQLQSLAVDGAHFPDVSTQRLLGVMEAVNFRMTFPHPKPLPARVIDA